MPRDNKPSWAIQEKFSKSLTIPNQGIWSGRDFTASKLDFVIEYLDDLYEEIKEIRKENDANDKVSLQDVIAVILWLDDDWEYGIFINRNEAIKAIKRLYHNRVEYHEEDELP